MYPSSVQSEYGVSVVESDPVKALTNGEVDHTQQGLNQSKLKENYHMLY